MVWIKIRVMAVVAIASPPAVVDRKLRQVSEPIADEGGVNSGGGAAHQGAKRIEICRSRSLGDQVRVEELVVSDLIIGIVMDVLGHVFVHHRQGGGVGWVASCRLGLRVLDAAEFVVLDPKVGLEYLQQPLGTEAVAASPGDRSSATCFCGSDIAQQSCADCSCSNGE